MKQSIFYFDDEAVLLDIFAQMFGDEYEVQTATTLADARRILSQCAVDIIISDQNMPEIRGAAFLRESAAACPNSFRIMLTGQAGVGDVLGEVSNGIINIFVTKPWTEPEMRKVLERAALSARQLKHHCYN